MTPVARPYDFVIIGSGFGGSVAAMRLAQKGYRIALVEAGRRWRAADFPASNWNLRKYAWLPALRCFGIQRITLLKGLMVLHGAGVGGGSLVYANTLLSPEANVLRGEGWPAGVDWQRELEPHYREARRMLGVTVNPLMLEAEESLRRLSERMGAASSFRPTDVGVFFGEPGRAVPDPYFSGAGPERAGCTGCGGCMVGCRYRAKNTLDLNYLYFAETWGCEIYPEITATRIVPQATGYLVETRSTVSWFGKAGPTFRAERVIVAAGVLGTVDLLLRSKLVHRTLPDLSGQLGHRVRTNGESLLGATSFDAHKEFSRGVAIGAAFRANGTTTIEAVKYPSGSNLMRLLAVPLTGNGTRLTRPLKMALGMILRIPRLFRIWLVRDWARHSMILLVMQTIDQTLTLTLRKTRLTRRARLAGGATDRPVPSYLPVAQDAAALLADEIRGEPQNVISEVLLGTPATAHILGGCVIADDPSRGVIDGNHEAFGYPGLYVCDGSVIPVNLGVNPSLTITALAERFASRFPVAATDLFKERQIAFSLKSDGEFT